MFPIVSGRVAVSAQLALWPAWSFSSHPDSARSGAGSGSTRTWPSLG